MKPAAVLVIAACILAGCGEKSVLTKRPPNPLTPAHAVVTELLIDPKSAMFRHERVRAGGDVCGEVNSKNSFNGYVGFTHYVYVVADHSVHLENEPAKSPGTGDANLDSVFMQKDRMQKDCRFAEIWYAKCLTAPITQDQKRYADFCRAKVDNWK